MVLANIFQPLIDIFGPVLVFFHSIIGGSWGWSIIALTVVVRALLLPLAFKQMHSMQKLQQVAPQMKAIQAKYKDDKQRQQQEIMKFYRENEINPLPRFSPWSRRSRSSSASSTRCGHGCARTSVRASRRRFATPTRASQHPAQGSCRTHGHISWA